MFTGDWLDIGPIDQIPLRGSRTVPVAGGEEIAVFRTGDNEVFALVNRCPHKHGPLSQGIVHGHSVACPLHNWNISLKTGEAQGEDKGCTPTVPVKVDAGRVLICRASTLAAAA
ncbi:MAG: nitrite reductase small subunit NirD [Sphingomonadaceae bacterium]